MEYTDSEFMVETHVPPHELIISRTDLTGKITHANETFVQISGYSLEELIGQPHSIVRHPDMPRVVFEDLWRTIQSGRQWTGIVKNMRKDRGYYWVKAIVSGVFKDDELIEYKSIRAPITFDEKLSFQRLYDRLKKEHGEPIRRVIYE